MYLVTLKVLVFTLKASHFDLSCLPRHSHKAKKMSLRNFLSITFLVVLGDVIAEALPALAAEAGMFETIDITTLEAGGLTYGDVAESSPMVKEPAPVRGGKRKKKTTQDDLLQLQ